MSSQALSRGGGEAGDGDQAERDRPSGRRPGRRRRRAPAHRLDPAVVHRDDQADGAAAEHVGRQNAGVGGHPRHGDVSAGPHELTTENTATATAGLGGEQGQVEEGLQWRRAAQGHQRDRAADHPADEQGQRRGEEGPGRAAARSWRPSGPDGRAGCAGRCSRSRRRRGRAPTRAAWGRRGRGSTAGTGTRAGRRCRGGRRSPRGR